MGLFTGLSAAHYGFQASLTAAQDLRLLISPDFLSVWGSELPLCRFLWLSCTHSLVLCFLGSLHLFCSPTHTSARRLLQHHLPLPATAPLATRSQLSTSSLYPTGSSRSVKGDIWAHILFYRAPVCSATVGKSPAGEFHERQHRAVAKDFSFCFTLEELSWADTSTQTSVKGGWKRLKALNPFKVTKQSDSEGLWHWPKGKGAWQGKLSRARLNSKEGQSSSVLPLLSLGTLHQLEHPL